MTCSGRAFAPATSGQHTGANESSSLPVPVATPRQNPQASRGTREREYPTQDASDGIRDRKGRKETEHYAKVRDIATQVPAIRSPLDNGTSRSLPTPTRTEATKGSPNARDSRGNPGLTAAVIELLPTPLTGGNRKSRPSIMRHRAGPGLEQAIEMSLGTMPAELSSWAEAPDSWTGASTRPQSDGGS